ncbi:MAG: NTP transferase domain-containing protein [Polyangiaceae bacterium]
MLSSARAIHGTIALLLASGAGVRIGGPKALLVAAPHDEPLVVAQCRDRLENESVRAIAVVRERVADLVGPAIAALGAEVVVSRAPDEDGPAGSIAAAAAHLGDTAFRAAIVTPVDVRVRPETVRALVTAFVPAPVREPLMEAPPAPRSRLHETPIETPIETPSPLHDAFMEAPPRAPSRLHDALMEAPPAVPSRLRDALMEAPPGAPSRLHELHHDVLAVVPRFAGRRGHPVVLGAAALARYRDGAPPPLRDHLRALGDRAIALDVDDPWILEDLDFAHQTGTLLRFTGRATPRFFP